MLLETTLRDPRRAADHAPRTTAAPPVALTMWEDGDTLHVEAELPGFALGDLDLAIADGALTISGRREPALPEGARLIRAERPTGAFTRTVRLPVPVDADAAEARLADGVLAIALPKHAAFRRRRIEVRTAEPRA